MHNTSLPPAGFPLEKDKDFLSESEWVILKLLIRPLPSLVGERAERLHDATGKQISLQRCDELIRTVEIATLPGLGSWIASIMAKSGLSAPDAYQAHADEIMHRINSHMGYPICNAATTAAFSVLQAHWKTQDFSQITGTETT